MGMIELSKIIILIDWIKIYSGSVHCNNMNRTVIRKRRKNNNLDKKFIYKSMIPFFVLAELLPIEILVSLPI